MISGKLAVKRSPRPRDGGCRRWEQVSSPLASDALEMSRPADLEYTSTAVSRFNSRFKSDGKSHSL